MQDTEREYKENMGLMSMGSILKRSILKKYFVNTSLGKKYLKYQNTKYCYTSI